MECLAWREGGELVGSRCPSVHPSLTAVLSERLFKQRVGLHSSGTGGSLLGGNVNLKAACAF